MVFQGTTRRRLNAGILHHASRVVKEKPNAATDQSGPVNAAPGRPVPPENPVRLSGKGLAPIAIEPHRPYDPAVWRDNGGLIGSIRRECLDHVIVFGEEHLRRILAEYVGYYHEVRAHLSLDRNSPISRPVCPPEQGKVVATAYLGGLHHCYTRAA